MLDVVPKRNGSYGDIIPSLLFILSREWRLVRTPYRPRGCHSIRLCRQRSERKAKPRFSSRRHERRIGAPRHVRRSRNPPEIRSIRVRVRKLDEREDDANEIATTGGLERRNEWSNGEVRTWKGSLDPDRAHPRRDQIGRLPEIRPPRCIFSWSKFDLD